MKIFSSILVVLMSFGVFACDICGGISSPSSDGLLFGNQYHFIGFRANYSHFRSYHRSSFSEDVTVSAEHFIQTGIVGQWQFAKRFNAQLNVPYRTNLQYIENDEQLQHGIGDLTLHINWMILEKKNESRTSNFLTVGAGVKTPTGNYSKEPWSTSNLSPGTGSWDPQFNLNYRLLKKRFNLQIENSFNLKTANKYGYRYGNAISSRANAFYSFTTKNNAKMLPLIGVAYLYTNTDRIDGYLVSESFNSGHVFNIEIGVNYLINNWMLNTKWAQPIVQTIANGDVVLSGMLEFGVHYLIQKK